MARWTKDQFVKKAISVHGSVYDYSRVEYKNAHVKVCIICKEHGEFWQVANNHVVGYGCPVCGINKNSDSIRSYHKSNRPDLSNIIAPEGSRVVPVGIKGKFALVDEEDYDMVMRHNWWIGGGGYAKNDKVGPMHRFIMNTPRGMHTDHIDHDKLNNRKINLRICTPTENARNIISKTGSSKFKGVSWRKEEKKWRSSIIVNGKTKHLGYFHKEEDAAKEYDKAALEIFREFARPNFI